MIGYADVIHLDENPDFSATCPDLICRWAIWHKPRMDRCGSPDYIEDPLIRGGTPLPQSSRSRIRGLTESARCAGIHVATRPSKAMATTTPARTNGSRGVAWQT